VAHAGKKNRERERERERAEAVAGEAALVCRERLGALPGKKKTK